MEYGLRVLVEGEHRPLQPTHDRRLVCQIGDHRLMPAVHSVIDANRHRGTTLRRRTPVTRVAMEHLHPNTTSATASLPSAR